MGTSAHGGPRPVLHALDRKIVNPSTMAQTLRQIRRGGGKTVVQCHGCFDIVHPGHIRYLQFARQLGDVLIVSLTADAGIQKGPDRPYIPQDLRAENLAALEFVDWVVIDDHPTACALLEVLRPDVYLKGREYAASGDPRFLRERQIVEGYGGRVVFHSGDVVFSSTRLLRSMASDELLDEHRLRSVCERGGVTLGRTGEMIEAFRDVRVVVVGDLLRERYVFCDASNNAGDAPVQSLQRLDQAEYWGGAAAVALQLRALGARPFLLTGVGQDEESRGLPAEFAERGVDGEFIAARPGISTRTTFLADDAQVFRVCDGGALALDSSAERQAADVLARQIGAARLLIWCDLGGGVITPGLLSAGRAALEESAFNGAELDERRVTTAGFATGVRSELRALRGCDVLLASERQLRETMHDMGSGLPAVAANLLNQTRGRALLVALRKRGLLCLARPTPAHPSASITAAPSQRLLSDFVPALARHYLDMLGSDAAMLATAALTIAAGGALPLAAYLACAAEAVAVSRLGSTPVTSDELHQWLAQRPELRPHSRFFPDAATVADLAALAPPLVVATA